MFNLVGRAVKLADEIKENQSAFMEATEQEEKEKLFEKAQSLGKQYSEMLNQIDKMRTKNTPLINRIEDSIRR
jgi:uncharacterized coiled-coil DUF342 family protein